MYQMWYDSGKSKYGVKAKLCYMNTETFILYIKTGDIYKEFVEMLKIDLILEIMNYIDHCLKEKNKKVI